MRYVTTSCSKLSQNSRAGDIGVLYKVVKELVVLCARICVCVVENGFVCRRENGTRFSQDDFCYFLISVSVGCKR